MSVVNQMLKDLEQTQSGSKLNFSEDASELIDVRNKSSLWVFISFSLLILLICTIGYWQFSKNSIPHISESASLQSVASSNIPEVKNSSNVATVSSNESIPSKIENDVASSINSSGALSVPPTEDKAIVETQGMSGEESKPNLKINGELTRPQVEKKDSQTNTNLIKKNIARADVIEATIDNAAVTNQSSVKKVSVAQRKKDALELATTYIEQKRYNEAQQELKKLLTEFQDYHAAREKLAYVYLQIGNSELLKELLLQALASFPEYTNYRILLAKSYAEKQDWESVISTTDVYSIGTDTLQLMRALAFQQLKQHQQAIEVYVSLLKREPERGDWWIGFAVSLEAVGRNRDAFQALVKADRDLRLTRPQKQYIELKSQYLKGLF